MQKDQIKRRKCYRKNSHGDYQAYEELKRFIDRQPLSPEENGAMKREAAKMYGI